MDRALFYAVADRLGHIWGVRVGSIYLTLCGPKRMQLWSERNRRRMWVMPIGFGWRVRLAYIPKETGNE